MCSSVPFMTVYPKKATLPLTPAIPLKKAQQAGIIDSNVMALGGISLEHLPEIAVLGFGGAVLLGDIWQQAKEDFIPPLPPPETALLSPFNF